MRSLPEILIAEDSSDDAELTIGALGDFKSAMRVVLVRDGAEALDYLLRLGEFAGREGANPILVLLDLKMPKVSGLEVLREVKKVPELADIPVVMLSSSRVDGDLKEARSLGASAYVVKAVNFQEFADAVRTIGRFWGKLNVLHSESLDVALVGVK